METQSTNPVVLLIDDSIDVHRLLTARLRSEAVTLVSAHDGREGLKLALQQRPSVVLLDLDMPEMDGFEVLRALKSDPATMNAQVIIVSGLHGPEDKVTAFELGATDYITKPFEVVELRARLRSALRISRLLTLLAERAMVDGLTGLGNRAHFDRRWAEEVSEATRHNRPLSLALIDVDFFKKINDSFGHVAGDEVLQAMGRMLQSGCRKYDVPCRYGGEEFAIIMPNTRPEDAVILVDRLREQVRAVVWPRHPERPVSYSAGVAGIDGQSGAPTPSKWLELADKNLYAAKAGGRGRSVMTSVNQPGPAAAAGAGGAVAKPGAKPMAQAG